MTKNVLVVAAHSDDEALGCAGTIAKHVAQGNKVHLLFMTDGVGARNINNKKAYERIITAQNVARILKVCSVTNLDFPDNKMDSVPLLDIVKEIENLIERIQPEVIYTHHIGDLNIDHQITHKAVLTACRPQPGYSLKEIYAFEILSSTEWQTAGLLPFCPNVYVDITDYLEKKIEVLGIYEEEMRQPPHSRSIENAIRLNAIRGNSVGMEYAEAFTLVRLLK